MAFKDSDPKGTKIFCKRKKKVKNTKSVLAKMMLTAFLPVDGGQCVCPHRGMWSSS